MSNTPKNQIPSWIRRTFIATAVLLVIASGDAVFHSHAVYAKMVSWKLIPQPQQFTELYFENSSALPTIVADKPVVFDFGVANEEGRTITYTYDVTFTYPGGVISTLETGSITLAEQQQGTVPVVVSLPAHVTSGLMTVTLPGLNQSIDFRMGQK